MYQPIQTAQRLAHLDASMRRQGLSFQRAVAARLAFVTAALDCYAVRRLNRLGDLVPRSALSERSLDLLFEDDRYNDAVVRTLVAMADADPAFKAQIDEQFSPLTLFHWRSNHPDLFSVRKADAA